MKWLKIVGLGIALWGLGLIWLEFKLVLLSPVILAFVAIVVIGIPAYHLGCFVGQRYRLTFTETPQPSVSLPRPTAPVFARYHHSRSTRPMPMLPPRQLHSNPTRPMPVVH
ncbi:MAG: hypothetical protein KDJ65_06555 [Anaerolineae bacterium]|nr:hypothetical protein [Anaerolineae bacterium]